MKEEGPLVIVTGASRGIGRSTVTSLCEAHGMHVLALARDGKALAALENACKAGPGTVETLTIDLASSNSIKTIVDTVGSRRVRALVHNAGAMLNRPDGGYEREQLRALFDVNVFAPLQLGQALLKNLSGDPPGHVVHIGSMGGFQDSSKFAGLAAYSASKAALACLSQCMAEEWKDQGVRSNCLALGAVDTEMLRLAFPGYRAQISDESMGAYVSRFALEGHNHFNGKVLPVAISTP